MTTTERAEAAEPVERLKVDVTLTITHSVKVTVDADSSETVDQLKQRALDEYHRDPNTLRGRARNEDTWRFQFANRTNIHVGQEQVAIAGVNTRPTKEWGA